MRECERAGRYEVLSYVVAYGPQCRNRETAVLNEETRGRSIVSLNRQERGQGVEYVVVVDNERQPT